MAEKVQGEGVTRGGNAGTGPAWLHVFTARRVESRRFAEIGGLVVATEARRRGVGRRLLDAARRWAAESGLSSLRVRSNVTRESSHAFYTGVGFEEIKRQSVYRMRLLDTQE